MAEVTSGTRQIISGEPIEIEEPVPDWLEVDAWYMAQPEDWLFDDAEMEYQAAHALALQRPSVKRLEGIPPSKAWIKDTQDAIETSQERVDALLEKRNGAAEGKDDPPQTIGLTAEEAYELNLLYGRQSLLADALTNTDRAIELANERASKARKSYLLPRLITDKDGHLLFDVETEAGRERWRKVSRLTRIALEGYLYQVLALVMLAKN